MKLFDSVAKTILANNLNYPHFFDIMKKNFLTEDNFMAFCTKCGKALAEGEKCTCETPVATEQAPQTEKAAEPKKKK